MHLYSSHGFSLKLHNLWQDQRFVFLACSWRCYGPLFSCWCHFLVSWGPDDARSWKTQEYYEFLKSVTHGSGDWEGPVGISSPASCSHWANISPCFPNVTLHYPLPCSCWLLFTWLLWLSHHFHLGQQGHWHREVLDDAQGWGMVKSQGQSLACWAGRRGNGWRGEWPTAQVGQGRLDALVDPGTKLVAVWPPACCHLQWRWKTLALFSVKTDFQLPLCRTGLGNDIWKHTFETKAVLCATDTGEQRLTKLFPCWYAASPAHFQPSAITAAPLQGHEAGGLHHPMLIIILGDNCLLQYN